MTAAPTARVVGFSDIPSSAWDRGGMRIRNPMQSHEWLSAAVDVFGDRQQALAVIVGESDRPDGLAVLGGERRLKLLGGIDIGESVEVIFRDQQTLDALAHGIARLGRPVEFGHYPTRSDFSASLRRTPGWRGLVVSRPVATRAAPSLILDPGWTDPYQQLGRSRRQSLRRKMRKAEKAGPVDIKVISPAANEVDRLFDKVMEIEAKSWKSRAGTALAQDLRQAEFFRNYAHRAARKGILRLCFMHIGEAAAAMQFAVVWENRFWSIKIGYDEGFSEFSPGELLTLELIRHGAEQGLASFEFCGKEADWTRKWTQTAQDIAALRLYPANPGGVAALLHDAVRIGKQTLATRLKRT